MADLPRPRRYPPKDDSPESSGYSPKERYAGDTQPMDIPPEVYRDEYDAYPEYPAYEDAQSDLGIPDGYDPYDMPRPRRRRRRPSADYVTATQSRPAVRRKRRRRPGCLGRLLRTVLVLFLVVFAVYSAVSLMLISRLDKVPDAPRTVVSGKLGNANYTRNVLLIGTDSRDLTVERGRSDSMILLTFNDAARTVFMTSFLRDAYVEIPNRGFDKLNAAYSYGGPELLMDTLELNFNISVDDYVCVSFKGFAGIIDSFGGVKITLTDEEAQAINNILQSEVNALMGDAATDDFLPSGGTFLLTGKQALSYARIRYVGNADFERTSRQREVLEQLAESAKQRAVQSVPELMSDAVPHVTTNMQTSELYLLSLRFPPAAFYETRQQQIPADGTWSAETIDGAAVLRVDTERNRNILQQTVFALNKAPED